MNEHGNSCIRVVAHVGGDQLAREHLAAPSFSFPQNLLEVLWWGRQQLS